MKKNNFEDDNIQTANLIDPATNNLVAKAYDLLSEWYDWYSDKTGVMTPQSTTRFILGATGEPVTAEDGRIKGLFSSHD